MRGKRTGKAAKNRKVAKVPVKWHMIILAAAVMLAYANSDAVKKTLKTGYAHYWSRSRRKLWMKGETSGNTQKAKRILVDCDYDALLYLVEQKGTACHTGNRTCFHNKLK